MSGARSRSASTWWKGQAMLAAARKYKRVVQIGTQRRSTPHLIEARDRMIREGKLGKIGLVEICCYYHMRERTIRPMARRRRISITKCGPGPRPCGPTTRWCIRERWRAFMEYGNGIVGDMCVHMLDMTRWMLDLGWPKRIASTGGILVREGRQGEHHRHADRDVRVRRSEGRLAAPHVGRRARSEVSVGRDVLRRQGHAEGERDEL